MTKKSFYAYIVSSTGESGVATSWEECKKKVLFKKARYRGFVKRQDAEVWLSEGAAYEAKATVKVSKKSILEKGIYFDAGTGRGMGVEVNVTDEGKKPLLPLLFNQGELTEFNTYRLAKGKATNNYGELLGCLHALKLAQKLHQNKIFSDSLLVLNYWSKGLIKNVLPRETIRLAHEVAALRKIFEEQGGSLGFVSGDYNPADLGFHR